MERNKENANGRWTSARLEKHPGMARGTAILAALRLRIMSPGINKRFLEISKWTQADGIKWEIFTT